MSTEDRIPLSPRDQEIAAAWMSVEESSAARRRGAGFSLAGLGGVLLLAGAALSLSWPLIGGLALLAIGGRVLINADDQMALLREELDRGQKLIIEGQLEGDRLTIGADELALDELPEATLETSIAASLGLPPGVGGDVRVHRLPESGRILWVEPG